MSEIRNVFIQVIEKPARKVIIKRGVKATEYWSYCKEVGCDVWGLLTSIKSISGEPVCLWLPKEMRKLFGLDDKAELIITKEGVLVRAPQKKKEN